MKFSSWNQQKKWTSFIFTVKFHETRWSFIFTVKFTQKISELSKMSVIVFQKAEQFHPNYQQNASAYVCGLNEKRAFLYQFQKWEKNQKRLVDFEVFFFSFTKMKPKKNKKNRCSKSQQYTAFLRIQGHFSKLPYNRAFYRSFTKLWMKLEKIIMKPE